MWWALRSLDVDEWLATVIKAMYADTSTMVKLNGGWCTSGFCTQPFVVHHCAGGLVQEVQRRPTYGTTVCR